MSEPAKEIEGNVQVGTIPMEVASHPLFGEWVDQLMTKAMNGEKDAWHSAKESNRGATVGVMGHPYNKAAILKLMNVSPHHSICLHRKVSAMTGLGFKTRAEVEGEKKTVELQRQLEAKLHEARIHSINMSMQNTPGQEGQAEQAQKILKSIQDIELSMAATKASDAFDALTDPFYQDSEIDNVLDPLCEFSFADLLQQVMLDYEHGDGYIETKRANKGRTTSSGSGNNKVSKINKGDIVGLYHIPAAENRVVIETEIGKYHYRVGTTEDTQGQEPQYFAKFGDVEDFWKRIHGEGTAKNDYYATITEAVGQDPLRVSEVIHFRDPNPQHRYYGYPQWLAAISSIELFKSINQYKFDFFNNRGVPEFIFLLTGGKLEKKEWQTVLDNLNANLGTATGKRKSTALNIENEEIEANLLKLGAESVVDTYKDDSEVVATNIVASHSMPPLLANIQIPGKLGANNELSQAILSFQLLNIGPKQRNIMRTLRRTLASPDSGLKLRVEDCHLRRITDLMDLQALSTLGSMRSEYMAEPGRDLSQGTRD